MMHPGQWLLGAAALTLTGSQVMAVAVGIGGTDTPETIGLSVGIGNAFPANPDAVEYYAGTIAMGQSIETYHQAAIFGAPASLAWFKFTSDGVSDVIIDTFGSTASFGFGDWTGNPGTELAIFDADGNFVLKQSRVRNDPTEEPSNVPPDPNGYETELPAIGNQAYNTPHNPLEAIATGGTNGALNYVITAIGPAPDYVVTSEPTDSPIIWTNNVRATSQLAFVNNPAPNPLWDPANPDYDPYADWDQYPILPAGDYFIALSGSARISGFAPDMVDQTKQVGDIVQNSNPATPDGAIPDDGTGNAVRFGFTTSHPNAGSMWLNLRKPGDFNGSNSANATDIDLLFDRVAELAGQGLDVVTGITLDGLPLNFLSIGVDDWEPEIHLSPTDMVLDLTGNSRIDMGDVTMLVHNILASEFGDANLDGVVDAIDQAIVEGNLGNPGGWAAGDFNGDDLVSQADLDILLSYLPGLDGDLNGDGFVGLADLDIVLGHWNQNVSPGDLLTGDPTGDGFVGLGDLDIVLGNWNAGTPPAGGNVPEPATLLLLSAGLAGLLARHRAGSVRS